MFEYLVHVLDTTLWCAIMKHSHRLCVLYRYQVVQCTYVLTNLNNINTAVLLPLRLHRLCILYGYQVFQCTYVLANLEKVRNIAKVNIFITSLHYSRP